MGDNLNGIFANMIQGMGFIGCAPNRVYNMAPPNGGGVEATAEGTELTLHSAAAPLTALTLYGKSEQRTTTGAQLAYFQDAEPYVSKGITWSCKNGIVTANGTVEGRDSSSSNEKIKFDLPVIPGDYFVSGNAGGVVVYTAVRKADNSVTYYTNKMFSLDGTEKSVMMYAQINGEGTTVSNVVVYPMLNAGSTALPWEPYTGGQPSPSPDYPQEIVSVGDDGEIGVNVYGGNLLHLPDGNMGKYISISNDIITINSGASGRSNFMQIPEMVFNPNKYTMSIVPLDNIENDGTFQFGFRISVDDKVNDYIVSSTSWYMGGVVQGTNGQDTIEITDKITAKYFNVDIAKGDFTGQRFKIMLNIGSTALPYEPYKQPQSLIVSTPNGLPGIPVSSGGNYTDANGQQWVCDEVDFKRGVYVQRAKKASNITWILHTGYTVEDSELFRAVNITDGLQESLEMNQALSSKLIKDNTILNNNKSGFYQSCGSIFARIKGVSELDEFNQLMADAEFLYRLDTPIETPLSPSELAAYSALRTYSPTTVVSNNAGAWMNVGYKATPQPMTMLARKR